jgi:hypothetical protein
VESSLFGALASGACRRRLARNSSAQSIQFPLPAIKGAIRSEGVIFGYLIVDGMPDALLRAGGRDDPHNPARLKSCQIRIVSCSS